jgi:hypothetical protein
MSEMHRRDLFRTGIQGAVAVGFGAASGRADAAPPTAAVHPAAPILAAYAADDHRRRLDNIGLCQRAIRGCLRKHLVTSYLPGQCGYNLGEYPSRKRWDPGEYDERELDRLKKHGIELIQVFDEWNDSLGLFGGDKFTSVNPAGFRRFVEMVHRRGMKIITYMSTCFFERGNPACRQEWYRENDYLRIGYWNMARCSPASPGWRATLLPHLPRILDDFGLDGIYIDGGYVQNYRKQITKPAKDEVPAFEETPQYDGAFTDLLALMYAEVKRRGGIFKLHVDGADQPRTGGMRVYDYLWVGEGVGNADALREATKDFPPYVVPCIDMTFAKVANEEEPFLQAIPYMQFPILQAGRPFTGERGMVPGVDYPPEDRDFWVRRCHQAWKYYQAHPNGPYTYGGWDAVPQRPETRATHARWLAEYRPMVEEGTWAWLEIGQSSLFARPLPKGVVASAFANRQMYLVLANYAQSAVEVETADSYAPAASPAGIAAKKHALPPRSLAILRRMA